MRTDMIRESLPRIVFCFGLSVLGSSVVTASCFPDAGSVFFGSSRTSTDDFSNRWVVGGSLECFESARLLQPRVLVGLAALEGDSTLRGADARYLFSTGGISFGQLFYATLGAGVYVTHLEAPIVPDSSYQLEFGYNGGVRFLLPMGHNAGIPFELLYHRIGGPGPDNLWTFTIGVMGW